VARGPFANWYFIAQTAFIVLALIASGVEASDTTPAQSQGRTVTNSDMLGTKARQAVIDIFRKKDVTAVDRYFGEPFTQHDPGLADGLAGMKSFAAEIASSPNANVKIYRTLVTKISYCCIPFTKASHDTADPRSRSTCSALTTAKSSSTGADRSRRHRPICRVAPKSTVLPRSLIVKRPKTTGH
jgi:hypothetical protein